MSNAGMDALFAGLSDNEKKMALEKFREMLMQTNTESGG